MKCYVYRSRRRSDAYLYLLQAGDFSVVPEALMRLFGAAEFALEFDLTPDRKLAQANTAQVLNHLHEQGFHLQMPPLNRHPI